MLANFSREAVKGGVLITVDGHSKFVQNKTVAFFDHGAYMHSQGVDLYDCFPGLTHDELKFLRVGKFECSTS